MASERACCSVPPVKSDYEAVGTVESLGDLPLYRVGEVCLHACTMQLASYLLWPTPTFDNFYRSQTKPSLCFTIFSDYSKSYLSVGNDYYAAIYKMSLSNNTKQFCDVLSKCSGYQVIMPDFFRGQMLKEKDLGDRAAFNVWLDKFGSYEVVSDLGRLKPVPSPVFRDH
jgi:hypothetical protein